ncbi:hypothetical protein RHMOL_Rhmol02G0224000 [Rhododendron molle]|uniref:Uncharacterized protein n=1 Tax=Rhododendron molle TaxID=49168 RepID=A0ACC0PTB4_RHOML|nr:hypothetical protein RHMOL_Rhmol02G0224000 [Rhododendron molle]
MLVFTGSGGVASQRVAGGLSQRPVALPASDGGDFCRSRLDLRLMVVVVVGFAAGGSGGGGRICNNWWWWLWTTIIVV